MSIKNLIVEPIFSAAMSFDFAANERVAVIGPSGAGKTTLLKGVSTLMGQCQSLTVDTCDVLDLHPVERSKVLSWTPERLEWSFDMSAIEVVELSFAPWGCLSSETQIFAVQALCSLGLRPEQRVMQMSSGELRRLTVAHTLCSQARVLVIDEPTANLDPYHAYKSLELLSKKDAVVLFATHDLSLALEFASFLIVLSSGRVVCAGEPEKVWSQSVLRDVFQVESVRHTHFGEYFPFLKPRIILEER